VRRARPAHDVPRPADRLRRDEPDPPWTSTGASTRPVGANVPPTRRRPCASTSSSATSGPTRPGPGNLAVAADGRLVDGAPGLGTLPRACPSRSRRWRRSPACSSPCAGVSETSAWPGSPPRCCSATCSGTCTRASAGTTPPAHCSWGARSSRTCAGWTGAASEPRCSSPPPGCGSTATSGRLGRPWRCWARTRCGVRRARGAARWSCSR